MELLDVGLEDVAMAVEHISEISCPPYQTVNLWIHIMEFGFDGLLSHLVMRPSVGYLIWMVVLGFVIARATKSK